MAMFYPGRGPAPSRYYMTAYDTARKNGFEGTPAEWIASLKGEQGDSAYQVAVNHGYTGTEAEFAAAVSTAPNSATAAASSATAASGSATTASAAATLAGTYLEQARACVPEWKMDSFCHAHLLTPAAQNTGMLCKKDGTIVTNLGSHYRCFKYTVEGLRRIRVYGNQGSYANYRMVAFFNASDSLVGTSDESIPELTTGEYDMDVPSGATWCYVNGMTYNPTMKQLTYEPDVASNVGSVIEAQKTDTGIIVKDGAFEYRWIKNGNNSIINWQSAYMDGANLFNVLTDWIGPYKIAATGNITGDVTDTIEYTGGNHLLDSTRSASKTGQTTQFNVFCDGKLVSNTDVFRCKAAEIRWVNKVQAGNTAKYDGSGREVLEEHCIARFVGGGRIEVEVTFRPSEEIKMLEYGGLSSACGMFATSVYIPEYSNAIIGTDTINTNRDDSIVSDITIYGDNASLRMHMDREYGIGKLANPHYTRGNGSGNIGKSYFVLYENTSVADAPVLASGGLYSWRGYYQLKRGSW